MSQEHAPESSPRGGLLEVAAVFTRLGLTSFGGPVAHIGYFRDDWVRRRRWLSDAEFADLVALCQFLPGPASSQAVFAMGMRRAGVLGGVLASLCFTLPSAILMIAFAYGVMAAGSLSQAGWLHGLKLAAVAVVAQAVWGMGRSLCPDRTRLTLCLLAAAGMLLWTGVAAQVAAIAAGGAIGWFLYRREPVPQPVEHTPLRLHPAATAALLASLALLLALPIAASATQARSIRVFDSFYRSGTLVFGGGHVLLPLLRAEVVPPGWVSDDAFLAGYGAAQAVPGPLFTLSAYLGAVMQPGAPSWTMALWCLLAIFFGPLLLVGGALPFWHALRSRHWAQSALRGANAAVVGVLLAALYQPVITEAVFAPRDAGAALLAFAALALWKLPPWALVPLMAAVGQWLL